MGSTRRESSHRVIFVGKRNQGVTPSDSGQHQSQNRRPCPYNAQYEGSVWNRWQRGIVRRERGEREKDKEKEKLLWGSPSTGQNHVNGSFPAKKSPPHRKIPATAALLFFCKPISIRSNSSSPVVIMVRMSGSDIPLVSGGRNS